MEIVIEYVLIENFLINFIVFKTTSLILHEKAKFSFLFSLMGACVTLAIPSLALSTFGNFLLVFGCDFAFVACSFSLRGSGRQKLKKFAKALCCFHLSSFLYGGACYFAVGLIGQNAMLVALFAVCMTYFLVKIVAKFSRRRARIENFCYDVTIFHGENSVKVKGFLDSGNVLFDPVTGKDVILINLSTFEKLCTEVSFEDVVTRSEKLRLLNMSHFVSIQGVASLGKIFAFQADKITIEEREIEKPILGLTFKNFSSLGSDVILNSSCFCSS